MCTALSYMFRQLAPLHLQMALTAFVIKCNVKYNCIGVNPYPANVENLIALNNANKWQMGFNPYPANVENMVSSK